MNFVFNRAQFHALEKFRRIAATFTATKIAVLGWAANGRRKKISADDKLVLQEIAIEIRTIVQLYLMKDWCKPCPKMPMIWPLSTRAKATVAWKNIFANNWQSTLHRTKLWFTKLARFNAALALTAHGQNNNFKFQKRKMSIKIYFYPEISINSSAPRKTNKNR